MIDVAGMKREKSRIEVRQSILYSAGSLVPGQGHEKEQKSNVSIGVIVLDVSGKNGEKRGKQDGSKEDILQPAQTLRQREAKKKVPRRQRTHDVSFKV